MEMVARGPLRPAKEWLLDNPIDAYECILRVPSWAVSLDRNTGANDGGRPRVGTHLLVLNVVLPVRVVSFRVNEV